MAGAAAIRLGAPLRAGYATRAALRAWRNW